MMIASGIIHDLVSVYIKFKNHNYVKITVT